MKKEKPLKLERLDDYRYRLPKDSRSGMHVDGRIYSSPALLKPLLHDASLKQVKNVATLPGIVDASLAMPDIHWGYGFPIGGVAAFSIEKGVISPGGVGYDINCGVNLTRTNLDAKEIKSRLVDLADTMISQIPCGVGIGGDISLSKAELKKAATQGATWALKNGYATRSDIQRMEENGQMEEADPDVLSEKAFGRGKSHLGTLGSGNHFLEIQVVDRIYDRKAADVLGLSTGQVTVMVHSGSRGFGYQICEEQLRKMPAAAAKYGISLADRQLACAPLNSPEGREYYAAMACAANFAWANRIILVSRVRKVFEKIFEKSWENLGMGLVFDVSHNIARFETHFVNGRKQKLCVHRKGATRAFGPDHPSVPEPYRQIGQPVLIPGDMGTASYVLLGTRQAMEETFGSTCHGAGRLLSRHSALKAAKGRNIRTELQKKGIIVRARKIKTLGEEVSEAYKDIESVVEAAHNSGLAKKVARLKPLVVIKG